MGTLGAVWLVLAVVVLLFVALRAVLLWYWRVNDVYDVLSDVRDTLKRIEAQAPAPPPEPARTPVAPVTPEAAQREAAGGAASERLRAIAWPE